MRNLFEIAAFLLPILFVLLCIRVIIAAIGPVIMPLLALAVIAFVAWLWVQRSR